MNVYAIWLTTGTFPAARRAKGARTGWGAFDPVFLGGVTVGAHAGWSRLQSVEFVGLRPNGGVQAAREQGTPGLNEILVTKVTDCASPFLGMACAQGRHLQPSKNAMVVKLDFTRAHGNGAETPELSVTLHDVVMERATLPQNSIGSVAAERFRLRYNKMTYSNTPPSSPDVSQSARLALMRTGDATTAAGSMHLLADGSVRFVAPAI